MEITNKKKKKNNPTDHWPLRRRNNKAREQIKQRIYKIVQVVFLFSITKLSIYKMETIAK